jgi:hypothetical protein
MFHIKNRSIIIKKSASWLGINTVIATAIFSFLSLHTETSLVELYLSVFIITQVISAFSVITGYSITNSLKSRPILKVMPLVCCGTLAAAFVGSLIGHYITLLLFDEHSYYVFPSLLIALIVTVITFIIEMLHESRKELEISLRNIESTVKEHVNRQSFSIKSDKTYHVIEYCNLVYLSSHGKKTILHTAEKEFETSQLLKDIETKLSDEFIRIHRQFIININYLSGLRYDAGGRYLAFLNDEEESVLPVGRTIAPLLKQKFGM